MSIPLDSERLVDLFRYVTRGLVAHHWSRLIPQNYVVRGGFFTPFGESLMRKVFQMRPAAVAQGNIGQGLLMYEGVQGVDDGNLTMWRFRLYGGLIMADDLSRVEQKATDLWMTTGATDGANFFDFD